MVGGRAARYTTAQGVNYLGIIKACYDTNKKPLTFNQPTRGPYLIASQGGYVEVYDDPDITYLVEYNGTAADTTPGQVAEIELTAGSTAVGQSRVFIAAVTANSGVTAAAVGKPFRVIGLGPNELDEAGGTGNDLEVVARNHVFKKAT
ncbi:MAG: hypothetical protein C4523_02480 [Myxococcales bacterium]|nr:MAG: hypothetical protein C4523_02480 [Myxococcales bacterium]